MKHHHHRATVRQAFSDRDTDSLRRQCAVAGANGMAPPRLVLLLSPLTDSLFRQHRSLEVLSMC